jgi:hypothetical protein
MRWPWRKDPDVDKALTGSASRLAEIKRTQDELEPEFRRLRRNAAVNHFEDSVVAVFKVGR